MIRKKTILKMMKKTSLFILLLLLYVLILFVNYKAFNDNEFEKTDTIFTTKTDTVFKEDTIRIVEPKPKIIVKTRVDTVYSKSGEEIHLVEENKLYQDTIVSNKDTAELKVFTSGINTKINAIQLNLKKSEVIKTNTIEVTKFIKEPKKFKDRFHISPQLGVGYGLINKKPDVYVGFGVSYEL